MIVELDLSVVPPRAALRQADDFTSLKVVATQAADTLIARAALERLVGEHATGPAWQAELEKMLDYAARQGWVRDDGAVQAHIEWR